MRRRRWSADLEPLPAAIAPSPVAQRERADPVVRSMLDLQRSAGNRAVATALEANGRSPRRAQRRAAPVVVAQRDEKKGKAKPGPGKAAPATTPPPPPQWLLDAQAIVNDMAKTDKLMGHVIVKKYSDLNATLRKFDFAAWTNSATEIFIKDPFPKADRKDAAVQAAAEMFVRFELQHEANHIHQFDQAGGPPATWEQMLRFEQEAYTNDLKFLQGAGKSIITDPDIMTSITSQVTTMLTEVTKLLDGIPKLPKKTNVEKHLWTEMKRQKMIPSSSKLDPKELYKQP